MFQPIPLGPNGEHHHGLVSVDGTSNVTMKIPQLRTLYKKVGFDATQLSNNRGFGLLHDGSVDSIARFVGEPVFTVQNDQEVADLVAFMLAFSGSGLPAGSATSVLEPPGTASQDTHAAVGKQTTLAGPPSAAQTNFIARVTALADAGRVGLVVKGSQAGLARGYTYVGNGTFQSDRAGETVSGAVLAQSASPGGELTYTVVPKPAERRIGIDQDDDTFLDRDELDAGFDPADPQSHPTVDRPPVAVDDAASTNEGVAVTVNVIANDSDPDGDPLTVSSVTQGALGAATNDGNGQVTYRPNAGLAGADSFTYTVSDGRGAAATATVRVTVVPTRLHVGDLDGSRANTNGKLWSATVAITVVDTAGMPVSDATVTGSWSAGASGTSSAVTNASGIATVQKTGLSRRNTPSVTFTVTGIAHATLSYNAAQNRDPDGDSDGTTIVVLRP
jgi:hypothetical protein